MTAFRERSEILSQHQDSHSLARVMNGKTAGINHPPSCLESIFIQVKMISGDHAQLLQPF
jgi:hypothetical protein